ncbi:sulfotransferase domain-containing protein [Shewanella baltica]|uniref:sulfotransferase domain-containing protein n=1 Tax=Shewanella baltica TaxID=62322 RepID=UPI003D7AA829
MNSAITQRPVIWLNGMPRSGTTWMSQVLASSALVRLKFCPLFSYEFKNSLHEDSTATQWQMLFEQVFTTSSEYLDQQHLRKHGLVPNFTHMDEPTHLVIKTTRFHHLSESMLQLNDNVKIVHLVRDPRACIASWLSNPSEFPADADPEEQWRCGECRKTDIGEFWGFDDWKHVTLQAVALSQRYPQRFLLVSYDQLMTNIDTGIKQIFDFCLLTYQQTTADFITQSHSKHDDNKRSVFKRLDRVTNWHQILSPQIIDTIQAELAGTELECFLQPAAQCV